ncbi:MULTISPECIES: lytic murein transglycosylase [Pseudomonas]|nr:MULTISPECIES: lytic murein transglycosylase [Pseudomonas]
MSMRALDRLARGLFALLVGMTLGVVLGVAHAAEVPAQAKALLPVLVEQQQAIWPDAPMPEFLAGQIEQESCITLKHSKCWNPRAELKTSREYGFGLGQTTVAYKKDGSVRFNKWAELVAAYPSLKGWSWANRYDAHYQLIAIVEMDKGLFKRQKGAATPVDQLSFALSAYNGGTGGVLQDRRLCANTKGCDPARWRGHVSAHSLKSRKPQPGYGKSFYDINREYVTNILDVRRLKYEPYFRGVPHD